MSAFFEKVSLQIGFGSSNGGVASSSGALARDAGDGFLAAFASAGQAGRCAIAIQDALRARGDRLCLRIGVHQGEVVPEGDDLLGDSVIVAARLEPLAERGGICIQLG